MNTLVRTLLAAAVLVTLLAIQPAPAQAQVVIQPAPVIVDDYGDGYWGWYDNVYQPYYYRQHRYQPYGYNSGYYYPPYNNNYQPYSYYNGYRNYYGVPNAGYQGYRGGGGQVPVGPMRLGWR